MVLAGRLVHPDIAPGIDSPAMVGASDQTIRFALDPLGFVSAEPGEERIEDLRFVLTFSPGRHVWSTTVGRVRLTQDNLAATVDDVRGRVRERGRSACVWVVSEAATPPDLVVRLEGLGLESSGTSDALLLDEPPHRDAAPDLEVRAVTTLEDLRASIAISAAAFGWPPDDVEDERSRSEETFRSARVSTVSARLLAFDAGRPVATGHAWFTPVGLYLGGGATLPTDRGRGAMTSLLRAAWDRAVERGTPALVTHGGTMSSPILLGLGFCRVGSVEHLGDRIV